MKNIYKALCFVVLATTLVACPKDDGSSFVIRDRQEVYDENIAEIEDYLKSNFLTVDANMDATVTEIADGGTETSIWDQYKSSLFGDEVPYITVKNDTRTSVLIDGRIDDDVDYKIYYIVLNEGGGVTPATVDSTFTAYRGWNLSNTTFDQNTQGVWSSFPESNVSFISGYRQILSKIKTEASAPVDNGNGTFNRVDFGNVIVFIPSGLAYFNNSRENIVQYGPICFQIKLYTRKERDHDGDKILTKYEDINNDGDYFNDDSDGDELPDFFDVDDDADGILTKVEITKPLTETSGPSLYYPYDAFTVLDDPLTPEDESLKSESKGVPRKFTGPNDGTSGLPTPLPSDYLDSNRLRRYLDATSKPPFE